MILRFKYFHDSLKKALMLSPGCEFSLLNYLIFCKTYGMTLNEGHFSTATVIVHFLDKPYQKINHLNGHLNKKSHLNGVPRYK